MAVDMGELKATMTLDKGDFDKGLRDSRRGLGKLGAAAAAAGAAVASAAAVIGTQAVQASARFEQAIVEAGIKVQATSDTLERLEGAALKAGKATKFTATESANALTFLGQAGFSAAEQIEALPGVLELAAAENMNVARTADIASNILQGFGKDTSELNDINDLLVKTSQSANTNVAELGQAMSFAAPAARSMGVSVSEAAAVVGQLSNAGIKAGRAGRGLRTVLAKMPEVARELGTTLSSSEVASLGLAGSLQKLKQNGLTADSALEQFGRRHGVVVQSILQEGVPALQDLTEEVRDNANAAGRAAEKQLDTLSGQFEQLAGSVDVALTKMGDELKPMVKDLTQVLRDHANSVSEAESSWSELVSTIPEITSETMQVLAAGTTGAMAQTLFPEKGVTIGTATEKAASKIESEQQIQQIVDSLIKTGDLEPKGVSRKKAPVLTQLGIFDKTQDQSRFTRQEILKALRERQQRRTRGRVRQENLVNSIIDFNEGVKDAGSRITDSLLKNNQTWGSVGQKLVQSTFGLETQTKKNTDATRELTKAQKEKARQQSKVKATQRARSVVKQAQRSLKGPAAARDAVQAAQAAVGGDVTGARAQGRAQSEAVADARQKARQLAGRTGRVQQKAGEVVRDTNQAFKEQQRRVFKVANAFQGLASSIEQAASGQRKFSRAAGALLGGAQTAAAGGFNPVSLIAGGAQALGGLISTFGGQQTSRQKQQARQRREQRKQIKQFANRTAERLADEMEERQLQARVIRIDASGALVGSEREVSSRLGDLLENEVGRREGFNI